MTPPNSSGRPLSTGDWLGIMSFLIIVTIVVLLALR
jgi:hypothetical protein